MCRPWVCQPRFQPRFQPTVNRRVIDGAARPAMEMQPTLHHLKLCHQTCGPPYNLPTANSKRTWCDAETRDALGPAITPPDTGDRHVGSGSRECCRPGTERTGCSVKKRPPQPRHREVGRGQDGLRADYQRPVAGQRARDGAGAGRLRLRRHGAQPAGLPRAEHVPAGDDRPGRPSSGKGTCSPMSRCLRGFRPKPTSRSGSSNRPWISG